VFFSVNLIDSYCHKDSHFKRFQPHFNQSGDWLGRLSPKWYNVWSRTQLSSVWWLLHYC